MPRISLGRLEEERKKREARARVRAWKTSEINKRKFYQLSEVFTLYARAMKDLAKKVGSRFPGFARGVDQFIKAMKAGKVKVLVEPGYYIEKRGGVVTKARIVYKPGTDFFVIEAPASMFDAEGNLKPEAMLDLFHELTHGVRSFIPEIERLPTAYDEATTNYIAKWTALYVAEMMEKRKIKPKYIHVNSEVIRSAVPRWERDLVFKPRLVEGILGKIREAKEDKEARARLYEEFARGWERKKRLRELVGEALREIQDEEVRRLEAVRRFRELLRNDKVYRRVKEMVEDSLRRGMLVARYPMDKFEGRFNENLEFIEHLVRVVKSRPEVLRRVRKLKLHP